MQSAERLQRELEAQTHAITALREDMSRLQSEKEQELEETIARCAPETQYWGQFVRHVLLKSYGYNGLCSTMLAGAIMRFRCCCYADLASWKRL